ncbi:MAG: PGPGW domain-containing protein [Verrucomicrobiales bacterium]
MGDFFSQNKELWWWLGGFGVVISIGTLIAIPIVIVRMAPDYFLEDRDLDSSLAGQRPVLRWAGLILKNVVAVLLIVAGIAMIVLPGQGLLTILIGLMICNFPGKRRVQLRILRIKAVGRAMNGLRAKFGRPPLELPDAT